MDLDGGGNRRVYNRPGTDSSKNQKVCFHWRAGKCTRLPCPFLHSESSHPSGSAATDNGSGAPKRYSDDYGFSGQPPRRGSNFQNNHHHNSWGRMGANKVVRKTEKVCNYWVRGNCSYGDKCKFLHSWSFGEGFSMLNHLDGHQKLVSGIVLPVGMDKLFTVSKDETLRAWDTNSGQCTGVINLGGEVGCMISEGPWLFVGLPNAVKVWNTQTNQDLTLSGPAGQVHAMVVFNDLLFAGTQDGILVWKFNAVTNAFEPVASLKGHTRPVVSLIVGANRLYSGSMDHSIKVWSLETLQCIQTLTEHNDVVMSLLCWDQFLLSCSLDKTIKVWVATENGNLEVTYTHNEENGVLNLRGMPDLESKPVLLCACNCNYVRLFDLPSFSERGKIFANQEIKAIEVGPGGLFFTGDGTGFKVWKWAEPVATS
ncbi:Zinc finger CCCH domain-containing protein 63 [Hibiscus syriacus]|uniref:Zinc finger CCCH domain-containing protein 63 n=1 Tax=Hibiscus syriacus TaxID=106335 RepID=A0A6A3AMP7_HIBSY|nr:zinc finger CCCH domain-containing protein 48-like [Hibiscus syriacus]KAE8704677.1 Zinc finger CCCH domain-containing protein 63 [Hibiscus syriacus]